MVEYNNGINNKILTPLSLRDIFKIFKRIVFQNKTIKDYLNIKIYHNILFYILSSLSKEDLSNVIDLVINKIKSVFSGIMKKDENLKNIFLSEPKLEILENREMICKGECGISINSFIKDEQDKNKIFEEIMSLPSLYNAFFKVLLSNEDEPILLTVLQDLNHF
jgi:DNA mismatch repair ATPase MutS